MKKTTVAIAISIFAASLRAEVTFDGEGKIATIPAGETYTIDEDHVAEAAALTNIVFGATTSTLLITNTTTALTLSADLTGAKGKVRTVSGAILNLVGNSPTFQGAFTFADSTVTVSNRYALGVSGSTVSSTNSSGTSNLYRLTFGGAGLTNDAAITCYGHHRFQRDNTNETLVFNKELAAGPDSVQIHFGNCRFPNGYKNTGGSPQPRVISGCDAYLGKLTFGGNITFVDETGPARLHLTANNNALYYTFTVPSMLTIVCEATNCLYSTTTVGQFYLNSNRALTNGRSFDLNGYDQTIRTITKNNYSEGLDRPEQIYSATPAVLTLNGISDTSRNQVTSFTLPMQFRGKASFKLNIPANATLNLSYGKSDSTETLEVAGGTLNFTQNAGWGGTNVVVSGGTLNVNSQYSISNANARLVVSAGMLVLNANAKVKSANIGGVELDPGAYALEDLPTAAQAYVSGASKLYVDYEEGQVTYKTSYWTGGAGSALTNAANWADGKAPNFADGGATLVFSNEVAATVDGSLSVYGIQLIGNRGVVISGTASDKLKLGHGGILSTNAFEAAEGLITNRIAVALQTTSAEADTWQAATGTVLDLDCNISGGGSTALSDRKSVV